ncbi:hypothetical protein FACS189414_5480 [Bacteroidia bacterium]|nr:hypothetical protein AGMMS49574_29820 [Bacteroidia bacterium]GHU78308.1 hypothetical protein FACS189414_5480 [Bacteroidia bacterium]
MKRTIYRLFFVGLLAAGMSGCSTNKTTSSYITTETECLGVELDGSQTLYAWGTGRSKNDAVEQAKKNAIRDVLFKGIRGGSQECNTRPLVAEVNAQERYESYFNQFFKDNGEYTRFVNMSDTRRRTYEKQENKYEFKYGATIRVLRSELRQKLLSDNILKQ